MSSVAFDSLVRAWLRRALFAALISGIAVTAVIACPRALVGAVAAPTLGYPWVGAKELNAANGDFGYKECPSTDPECKRLIKKVGGISYGEADPYGYNLRNCTSYVAWKLHSLGVPPSLFEKLHNGGQWAENADRVGRVQVDDKPATGAAAVRVGSIGHVAFVRSVDNQHGTITVEEYNRHLDGKGGTWTGKPSDRDFSMFVHFERFERRASSWRYLTHSSFKSDFNGDGKSDVFATSGNKWLVSYGGTSHWKTINGSGMPPARMFIGDFNGDGKSDVFATSGNKWLVSYGGTSHWKTINGSGMPPARMFIGDFNGDGKSDVFATSGNKWLVSYGGTSHWKTINGSGMPPARMFIGDFNGDGKSDVFATSGNKWLVSYGGTSHWKTINGSGMPPARMFIGDFNGDGKSDVFATSGNKWLVSYGGTSHWKTINGSGMPPARMFIGDFNGDGKSDVFATSGNKWLVSYGGTSHWKTINGSGMPPARMFIG